MDEPIINRLPDHILENIFSYLDLRDLRNCSLVSKRWYWFLNDENNDVWRMHCVRKLAEEALKSDLLSSVPTYKAKLRAFYHAWNPNDCSRNVYIKPNGFTLHRNPVAQSTDGTRGKIGFRQGRHSWEVIWEGPLGTVAVIGISTKEAALQCHGYVALLGSDDQSWGWNLVDNHLLHNGDAQGNYPLLNNAPKYQVGERIRVILDCDDNTLSFEKNYEFLGVAFRDEEHRNHILKGLALLESVSCLRFFPRTSTTKDYVLVTGENSGCHSKVGRRGGVQQLNYQIYPLDTGCFRIGTIVHEFLHALGFYHQQSTYDRDNFVTIVEENIQAGKAHNFNKYATTVVTDFGVPYDYESVMHYSSLAFSDNGQMTIVPKDPNANIGQRLKLSDADIRKLNIKYNCPVLAD